MKFAATAISVIAVASSASAFAPIQNSRGPLSVAVKASALDTLGLESLTSEVSQTKLPVGKLDLLWSFFTSAA